MSNNETPSYGLGEIDQLQLERNQTAMAEVSARYEQAVEVGSFEPINEFIGRNAITGGLVRTPKGEARLQELVTDTVGDVYTFTDQISPIIVAAAMARLSRSPDDMRNLILKEYLADEGKEEALLRRVVSQFGDDSVAQLYGGLPVVVEGASNLLTKQLEWGRIGAYLEQSTRYIYFDQKVDGRYRYHTPENLTEDVLVRYERDMDSIFESYSEVVQVMSEHYARISDVPEDERDGAWRVSIRGKACDAARSLLPVSTTSTVGIASSGQSIDNLIMHLRSKDLPEEINTGNRILEEVRKTSGIFFERTDLENRGLAISEHRRSTRQSICALAKVAINDTEIVDARKVSLLAYTPEDELDLVAYMMYPHSPGLSFEQIRGQVAGWDEEQKAAAFDLYMGERTNRRHKPGRALEHANYSFDVLSDYGGFRDLQRHRMVDGLEWQDLSPDLGHDIPDAVVEAGVDDIYRSALETSAKLYRFLLKNGYELESQYATLLGDKMRWKIDYNAREAFHLQELRTQPAGHAGYREIANLMHDEVEGVHPRIARAMIFVNRTDDDPSMGRLEQERRLHEKRRKLGIED